MVNYANGQIYKLVNNVDDEIYIGSTCGTLRLRKCGHKSKAKKDTERRVYKHLNEIGWDNVDIILIEACDCQNKDELHRRERYWIDTLNSSLNKVLPTRTQKEYYEDNKETIEEQQKAYRETHKEEMKTWREANKEVIAEQKKQHYEDNKEVIAEQKKEYYEANKQRISDERKKEKITCECGSTIRRCAKARHERTKKHQTYLASLE
jgi:group I intron endonuclease